MVRPRKIPRNFVPIEWSDSDPESESDSDTSASTGTIVQDDQEHGNVGAAFQYQENEEDEEDEEDEENEENEDNIPMPEPLEDFAKEWILIEMSHTCLLYTSPSPRD